MHNSYKKTIYGVRAALESMAQGVDESTKYHIPEDIPQNERTAFHGAAAAAAKSGKKSFNFGGKTHPVTMKKDTANAIADQKEAVKEDPAHYAAIAKANARKQAERDKADPEGARKRKAGQAAIQKKFSKNPVKPADIGRHSGQAGGSFVGRRNEEIIQTEATHTTDYFTGHKHAERAGMKVKVHSKGADGDNVTVSHSDPKKLQKYVDNHLGGGKIKEAAGIPHKYTVDLYNKDHGSHSSFIKKAQSAGIKGVYSGVNSDGKVKVSLNHHDNSDGGTIHKFLKKHYDKDMTHGNMQTMKTGSSSQKESMTFREKLMSIFENDKASHYKSATKPETEDDKLKGAGAKQMKADLTGGDTKAADMEKQSHADAAKAGRAGPGTKARTNDNKKGDKKAMTSATPVNDPTAKIVKTESYGISGNKISSGLLDAVAMVEDMNKVHTVDIDHMTGTAGSHEKKHGITLKKGKNYGKGPGSNMATDATGTKANLQKYLKKHYDGEHKEMHPEIYK